MGKPHASIVQARLRQLSAAFWAGVAGRAQHLVGTVDIPGRSPLQGGRVPAFRQPVEAALRAFLAVLGHWACRGLNRGELARTLGCSMRTVTSSIHLSAAGARTVSGSGQSVVLIVLLGRTEHDVNAGLCGCRVEACVQCLIPASLRMRSDVLFRRYDRSLYARPHPWARRFWRGLTGRAAHGLTDNAGRFEAAPGLGERGRRLPR